MQDGIFSLDYVSTIRRNRINRAFDVLDITGEDRSRFLDDARSG